MNPEITDTEKIIPKLKSANFVRLSFLKVLFIIILTPIVIFIILLIRAQILSAKKSEFIYNTKQIGLALFAFEDEYGSFPSKDTLALIEKEHPNHGLDLSGNSSNALLRQLYVDTGPSPEALKKGRFHYAYISDLSSPSHPSRPILFGPVIPGTKKIDPKAFNDIALVLRVDNSAGIYKIHKDGTIHDKDGLDILSPNHPIWNGKAPDIRYPE